MNEVALAYPQLMPFKILVDEDFLLSIYSKGYNLSEKTQMVFL